jgi:hypothetical protein
MAENGWYVDIASALAIDSTVVLLCAVLLLRYARLSHSHPGTIYLFFHIYTVTLRLVGIAFGAPTLFSEYLMFFDPIRENEIVRAGLVGDLALGVMTIAWIKASLDDKEKASKRFQINPRAQASLRLRHIWTVVAVSFPLGLFGLWAYTSLPGLESERINLGEWQASSWFFITQVWAGLGLLALIYWYGFKWWLVSPMTLYLLVMALQGYHRFRVIIPAILLIQVFLDRRRLRWPPAYVIGLILLLMAIFFPLKDIGKMAQEGEAVTEIFNTSRESVNTALSVKAPDQQFLDQFACALTLMDEQGKLYYGSTYLNLITLPIPRQWWPDKPSLADYIKDISVPTRPMSEMGMIVTYLGESYANFGYLGIIVVPYILAYVLARIYFRAYRSDYYSVIRFTYLLVACNLLQVYRDGLVSIIVFTWVNMMPLVVVVGLHYVRPKKAAKRQSAIASTYPAGD